MKTKRDWRPFLSVLVLSMLTIAAGSMAVQAKTSTRWVRVQNGLHGYALDCPNSAIVRRYDPEGILHIVLPEPDEIMMIRLHGTVEPPITSDDLAITSKEIESLLAAVMDDLKPSARIENIKLVTIGRFSGIAAQFSGALQHQQLIIVVAENHLFSIIYPLGDLENEASARRILETFRLVDSKQDVGFEVVETAYNFIDAIPVPTYYQNDSRWVCDQLGNCTTCAALPKWACPSQPSITTIGDAGCTVTSYAMIFEYYTASHFMTPLELDSCYTSHGEYSAISGCGYCGRYWDNLNTSACKPSGVTYLGETLSQSVVDADLQAGHPLMGELPGHYVAVTGKSGGNYTVNDPVIGNPSQRAFGEFTTFVRFRGSLPDSTPPTTSCTLSGTMGEMGWYVSSVQASFAVDEAVQWTKYCINDGTWNTYSSPFSISCTGIHALDYYSKDIAGNEEVVKEKKIKIDQITQTSLPAVAYVNGWEAWSPRAEGTFDVGKCTPLGIGDLNGDGYDDLVCVYDYGSSTTQTWAQISSGTGLSGWVSVSPRAEGIFNVSKCTPLHIGDVNGDGYDDLVCPYDYGSSTTQTWAQVSSGTGLSGWVSWSPRAEGTFDVGKCTPLHIGDINGDGYDDLACVYDYGSSTTQTWAQISSGTGLSSWVSVSPRAEGTFDVGKCTPLHIGDVNGDGHDDLVCAYDYGTSTTQTWAQVSSGAELSGWVSVSPRAEGTFDVGKCTPLGIGDLNADGYDDLFCPYDYGSCTTQTWAQISSGSGLGGWVSVSPRAEGALNVGKCTPLHVGDVNGDGYHDLVCPYDYGSSTTITLVQLSSSAGFSDWVPWGPRVEGTFDLSECASLLIGDLKGNTLDEIVCPYDYGASTTRTWVQSASRIPIFLPLILR